MRWKPIVLLGAALVGLAALHATPALASACNREIVAYVRMTAGQACWTYRGPATTFVGDFGNGQRVSAQMSGRSAEYDPRTGKVSTSWRPRDPNVEGPGGFYFADAEAPGALTFVAPANGTYRLSFSPCSMWGGQGAVRICAK